MALLLETNPDQGLAAGDRQRWLQAHQRPRPRLDVVNWLRHQSWGQGVTAMDSSDGLANAVLQICQASGVGACLEVDQLPLDPALVEWVGLEQAVDWCLYGGEDFELILCLPRARAQALQAYLGPGSAIVGQITCNPSVVLQSSCRPHTAPTELSLGQGFQHF
ncbi:MAG: hypothetical protein LVS60_13010 [Nodosilinea sp. LVE1205-7]